MSATDRTYRLTDADIIDIAIGLNMLADYNDDAADRVRYAPDEAPRLRTRATSLRCLADTFAPAIRSPRRYRVERRSDVAGYLPEVTR